MSSETGRAVLRTYLNVSGRPISPATSFFDATSRAGQAMDLALRIRRHGVLSFDQLKLYGELAALRESDLRMWCLKALEASGLIEVTRDVTGAPTTIEEQVGVAAPILEQAADVWESFGPGRAERCAIASTDHLSYAPLAESDHRAMLEAEGFEESLQDRAFRALRGVGILRSERSVALREDVLYSPYVWGSEAVEIAEFMRKLPPNERQVLARLSQAAAERPGIAVGDLVPNERLIVGAQQVGLIDAARVTTTAGGGRDFAFSPTLERVLGAGSTDVAHERKLFVAHILYGHRYASWSYGRIRDPLLLVRMLIERRVVGPATSIGREYPLLEAKGIVRVEELPNGRALLHLVKRDVAEDSLKLLRQALTEEEAPGGDAGLRTLWLPGTFSTPEAVRRTLPEIPPSAEAEVLGSVVEQLREETARVMRGETV
jgi:hypothetical protein